MKEIILNLISAKKVNGNKLELIISFNKFMI